MFFARLIYANIRLLYKDVWIFYEKDGKQVRRKSSIF